MLDKYIIRPRLAQTEEIGERGKPCIELTILFGQLTLCLVSRAKMSSHPVKSLFGRTGIDNRGSLGASPPPIIGYSNDLNLQFHRKSGTSRYL